MLRVSQVSFLKPVIPLHERGGCTVVILDALAGVIEA